MKLSLSPPSGLRALDPLPRHRYLAPAGRLQSQLGRALKQSPVLRDAQGIPDPQCAGCASAEALPAIGLRRDAHQPSSGGLDEEEIPKSCES